MKITKQRLKEIIKEELNEAWSDPFSEARGRVANLVDRLRQEERSGRPIIVSSRAGEDINVLEELNVVLDLLVQHQNDMKASPQEE